MGSGDAVHAVRHSVAVSALDHVRYVRLCGEGAYDALDRVCPADLFIRDGQVLQGLLLGEDASLFADVYVARDDEDYMLLAEGPSALELVEYLRHHAADVDDVEIVDMSGACSIIGLDGPYAWELMGAVAGEEVIGLPYLNFFNLERWICLRAGKTGEYGYILVVPSADRVDLYARCLERGAALEAVEADVHALDQCALENWFLNIRREGAELVTPIELQLQWRVSYRKEYVGSHALARRRAQGQRQRLICLVSDEAVEVGFDAALGGETVGRVVNAGYSDTRGEWVVLAFIDVAWAHSGIDAFSLGGSVPARSVSPPVINNRSLYVSPQLHSFRTRDEFDFPPLTRD